MHHTNTSTVRSVVSEFQTLLRNVQSYMHGTVRLVRTLKQRTIPVPSQQAHRTFL